MIVAEIKKIEDCLASKNVWDLYLNRIIDENFIARLETLGKLNMHQYKPKPFFQLIVRGKYTLKGSVGNRTVRLIMPDKATTDTHLSVIKTLDNLFS
jgi:hypothetical protein